MKRAVLSCFFVALIATGNLFATDLSATNTESFQIQNQKFGDLLRPEGADNADGTRIVLYPAEAWKCMTWKLHPTGESNYVFQNHFTSKTFSVKLSNTNLVQIPLSKNIAEQPVWRFKQLADGAFEIYDAKSRSALTAIERDGTVCVVLAPWQDSDAQKWLLMKIDPATLSM